MTIASRGVMPELGKPEAERWAFTMIWLWAASGFPILTAIQLPSRPAKAQTALSIIHWKNKI